MRFSLTSLAVSTRRRHTFTFVPLALVLAGCPMDDDGDGGHGGGSSTSTTSSSTSVTGATTSTSASGSTSASTGGSLAPTHTGLVSIQDVSIAGAPQAGHGLTVQILFTEARAPHYEELPGQPTGCKAWVYDVDTAPPPPLTDQGTLRIGGLAGGEVTCVFENGAYVCPLWSRGAEVSIATGANGTVSFVDAGATFAANDVGRYLRIRGAGPDAGAYPILAVPSPTTAVLFAPSIVSAQGHRDYDVVAGAGPTPGNSIDPVTGTEAVTVTLDPGGEQALHFPPAGPITPGAAFTPDDASSAALVDMPIDGRSVSLGCGGQGGACSAAVLTVVRLTTTDGDVAGLSPAAMPAPVHRQVDILCAGLGDAPVTIPAEAMALVADADVASPVTRIRTALMREGYVVVGNTPPEPENPVRVLVGHGILGFTTP